MNKPILCLDFDGVIHSYTSGWQGIDVVADPPVTGALGFIMAADEYFRVAIYSTRSAEKIGREAMQKWLFEEAKRLFKFDTVPKWLSNIEWPSTKPSAFLTIDDRALTFTGDWPDLDYLRAFKPWNKK